LYAVWIKVDETLPWIELKGEYPRRSEAKKAADDLLNGIKVKIVRASERRKSVKALATMKSIR